VSTYTITEKCGVLSATRDNNMENHQVGMAKKTTTNKTGPHQPFGTVPYSSRR